MPRTTTLLLTAALLSLESASGLAGNCPTEDGPLSTLESFDTYGPLTAAEVPDGEGVCGDAFEVTLASVQPSVWNAGFQIREDAAPTDVAGTRYRVRFRYRAAAPRTFFFLLNSRRKGTYGDGGDHTYVATELAATTAYQAYEAVVESVRAPADGETHALYFLAALGNATAALYLDDVTVEPLAPHHTTPGTWHVAPYGDDANDGASAASPWRSLPHAFSTLVAGDTLLLADGTYDIPRGLTASRLRGTPERPTVIRAVNPRAARIVGGDRYEPLLKVDASRHVVVEGLELTHPGETTDDDWATGIMVFESDYVTVRDNYVHDCGCNGVSVRQSDYVTVEGNVSRGNARTNPYNCSGISVYQPRMLDAAPGPHIVIRGNVVYENECRLAFAPLGFDVPTDGNGIILDDYLWTQDWGEGVRYPPYTAETLIENNLAFGNGGAGIKAYKVPHVTVRHNTVYHNNYVLADYTSATAEITFQAIDSVARAYGNIAVKPFGQPTQALALQGFGYGGAVLSSGNHYVGPTLGDAGLSRVGDVDVSEDVQSHPRFVDATAVPGEGWAARDFAALFALRDDSPLRNAGDAAYAPLADLLGAPRSEGGAPDLGAFEGARAATGPLPEDGTLVAVAPSSPEAMRVDGEREGFYTGARYRLMKSIGAVLDGRADLDAEWTGAYRADTLYLVVDVTDDLATGGDAVHVYLDGRHDRAAAYGPDDAHVRIDRDGTAAALAGGLRVRAAASATERGYRVEVALALTDLGVGPTDATEVGFEVAVTDGDAGAGTHEIAWQATAPGAAASTEGLGTLTFRAVTPPALVPYGAAAATVDARDDEAAWATAPRHRLGNEVQPGAGDLAAEWRSYYDAEALYFLVDVTDDDLRRDSGQWYEDDGVEIYLDADNSKDFASYGANDYQLTVAYDGTAVVDQKGQLGPGATAATRQTATGYVVEVALPWAAIGAAPAPGLFLGVDVHVNDDDGGGAREGKRTWFAEIDESYRNPALFGTVYLASPLVSDVAAVGAVAALRVYPNPTADRVTVDVPAELGTFDLAVVDARGATVLTRAGLRGGSAVSLGDLPIGVYVLRASSPAGQWRARVVRQ